MPEPPEITPLTRIAALLEAYPELEHVLIEQSPAFGKLRNPVLRRTVAKVATVENAASMAGLDARELVATLRRAVGQDATGVEGDAAQPPAESGELPDWLPASGEETHRVDAGAMLEQGVVPIGPITEQARSLEHGEVLRIDSGFRPAPLIEALQRQGLRVHLRQVAADRFETYVTPQPPTRGSS